tara:strand:+ start:30883 stop:31488 length:606 start_codon:yes stop_codon:yes gene_type:complete
MSHLKNYINQMTNPELIGLAKNRFLDTEDQVAIAKHHYRRAHNYLIENSSLSRSARDILWDYKGYARKCELITYGHFLEEQDKYHELYDGYAAQMRGRSPWRLPRVFLHHYRWHSHGVSSRSQNTGTPPEIIEDIYLKDVQRLRATTNEAYSGYYYSGPSTTERMIIENENTPLELIVKISASSPDDRNRNLAMKTMARRS